MIHSSLSILIGLIFGSFINVVVARLPQNKSLVAPGSHCPHCQKSIRWFDNIPLLSFVLLRGKCRFCKKPISVRYPLIEFLTALLFFTVESHFGWTSALFLRHWPFVLILVSITFIDLEHRIIPNALSLGGLALGLATCWLDPRISVLQSFLGAFLGYGVFYSLAWVYQKWRGISGLGGGDIKFLAMIGSFLGPTGVFITIFISSITATLIGVIFGLLAGQKNFMKMSLPYGPFLVIGALFYYLLGDILWFQFMIPM